MTWLCERDDFPELLDAASAELNIHAAILEKDYYVTEALRLMADRFGDQVLFKGGTSLSKGWKLIERFSEDIDLYVQVEPGATPRAIDRTLKALVDRVATHPLLNRDGARKHPIGGLGRDEYFNYTARAGQFPGVETAIKLEAGIQSGTEPWEARPLLSLLAEFLDSRSVASTTPDRRPFSMRLLHFRRTFVEKLFTIHDKVERQVKASGEPLGSFARHYYDLYALVRTPEVQNMLASAEYVVIAADYRRLTRKYFTRQALPPLMCLAESSALFPDSQLANRLRKDYDDQCGRLCYGPFPSFDEVLRQFEGVRPHLVEIAEQEDV